MCTSNKIDLKQFLDDFLCDKGIKHTEYSISPFMGVVTEEKDNIFYFTENNFSKSLPKGGYGYKITFNTKRDFTDFFFLNRFVTLDQTLVKLEENKTFTVGSDKDFQLISEAVHEALNYYPNLDYKITILIDAGFEINENISYHSLDFSHIIIKTTGFITVKPELTGLVFIFDNCWLPVFDEFYINGHTSVSHLFLFRTSFASLIKNSEISGFKTSILYNGVFSSRIEGTIIEVPAVDGSYGINVQNSYVRTDSNTQIVSLNTANLNLITYGVFSNSGSILSLSGTPVLGNFRRALYAQNATIISSTQTLEAREHSLFVERSATIINMNTGTLTSNVPLNTLSGKGLILNENKPNPINFDGTGYVLDYIKAPLGQEYNLTVDDTGKLKSEPKPQQVQYVTIELSKSEIEDLHKNPYAVDNSLFDLEPGEVIRIIPEKCSFVCDSDGSLFIGTDDILIKKKTEPGLALDYTVFKVNKRIYGDNTIENQIFSGFKPENSYPMNSDNFEITVDSAITVSGIDAFMRFIIAYEILSY